MINNEPQNLEIVSDEEDNDECEKELDVQYHEL